MPYMKMKQVVETIKGARRYGKKTAILIGAGCSVSAGIPTAERFVEIIKRDYPGLCEKAAKETYPHCMAAIAGNLRKNLIAEHVDKAKINWAHIAIAQLMKHGHVDRVLTTNFDPLLIRACSLVGIFPAAYDLASSQIYDPEEVPERAVFYLHGQRTGFVLMNTESECKAHSEKLNPVFEDCLKSHVWLVVGYSGKSDPVFEHLARVKKFGNSLFWVGYENHEPEEHVRERLLGKEKAAFYVKGYDADSFFVGLSRQLGCFPPESMIQPFKHLKETLETVVDYPTSLAECSGDFVDTAREKIGKAIQQHDQAGLLAAPVPSPPPPPSPTIVAAKGGTAHYQSATALLDEAAKTSRNDAERLLQDACSKFSLAIEENPEMAEAYHYWGNALTQLAKMKQEDEADTIYYTAYDRYERALRLAPEMHGALKDWQEALSCHAAIKSVAERESLLDWGDSKLRELTR